MYTIITSIIQTGVWDMLGGLEKHFISPLRQLLLDSRAYCRGDLQRLKEEMKEAKSAEGGGARVEMTVEVPRAGNLPEPTPEDEVKVWLASYVASWDNVICLCYV